MPVTARRNTEVRLELDIKQSFINTKEKQS